MPNQLSSLDRSARVISQTLISGAIVVAIATAFALASDIFLIFFLGILFGVLLSGLSRLLTRNTPITYLWSLGIAVSSLLLLMLGFVALFGAQISGEVQKASKYADEGVEQIQEFADAYPSVKSILRSTPFLRDLVGDEGTDPADASKERDQEDSTPESSKTNQDASKDNSEPVEDQQMNAAEQGAWRDSARQAVLAATSVFTTTLGLGVNLALIFFVGLFLAISPELYRDGVVILFPPANRERVREILNKLGDTLWHWLIGRCGSMLVTGVGAGLLLLVLGVPMAFTLAVLTALLTFIPNIGSAVALILTVLIALPSGSATVWLVVAGYLGLQMIESYIVTPLIQQQQVSLPPALLIATQAMMGVLFGFLGAVVASPLLAVTKAVVEEAYVKDVLEQEKES